MNRTKETENNNKPETKMLKKIATLIALGLLVTGNAAAYTHTYSRTVTNGQYFTQGYSVSAPSAVSFNSSAWCTSYESGGNLGVSGPASYDLWFGGFYPLSASGSVTGGAGSYLVYFNFGSSPGNTAYAATTVSW
jgi:hypothetical protein